MSKLDFDEAMYRLADDRLISADEVQARALDRKVWVAAWGIPGCLYESWSVCTTKADALACALDFMGEERPRGARKALEESGFFQHQTSLYGWVNTVIEKKRLRDLF